MKPGPVKAKTSTNSFRETRNRRGLGFLKFMTKTKAPEITKDLRHVLESQPAAALDLLESVKDQLNTENAEVTLLETAKELQSVKKTDSAKPSGSGPVLGAGTAAVAEVKAVDTSSAVALNGGGELPLVDAKSDTDSDPLESINTHVMNVLYVQDHTRWAHFWAVIEDATSWKRESITYGLFSGISGFLILLNLGEFVASAVGVVYPLIATYQVLHPLNPRDPGPSNELRDHWFRYWSIYALVNTTDVFLSRLCGFIPTYQFCKVFFLLGVAYPEWTLSKTVYEAVVAPVVKWTSKFINKYIIGKEVVVDKLN